MGRRFRARISLLTLTAGEGYVLPTRQKGCYGHKSHGPSVGPDRRTSRPADNDAGLPARGHPGRRRTGTGAGGLGTGRGRPAARGPPQSAE